MTQTCSRHAAELFQDEASQGLVSLLAEHLHPIDPAPVPDSVVPEDLFYRDLLPSDNLTPAAVLVPLVLRDQGWHLVLTQRTAHLKHHPGQISFPGGRLEAGEDTLQAAIRETHEEIGVDGSQVKLIAGLDQLITITSYAVIPIVGIIDPAAGYQIDTGEVAEVFEVPAGFVLSSQNQQKKYLDANNRKRAVDVIQWQQRMIWGATATMLVNFSGLLGDSERQAMGWL